MNTPRHIICRRENFPYRRDNLYEINVSGDGTLLSVSSWRKRSGDGDEAGEGAAEGERVHEGAVYVSLGETKTFSLEELFAKQWEACTVFCLACDEETGAPLGFYNRTAFSMASRVRDHTFRGFTATNLLFLYVPFEDATFADCSIVSTMGEGGVVLSDTLAFEEKTISGSSGFDYASLYDYVPRIVWDEDSPSEVEAEGTANLAFTVLDNSGQVLEDHAVNVYLSSDGGYLPRTKIPVTNGRGTARIHAMGLGKGERVCLKIGFRWFVNDTVKELEVI